MKYTLNQLNRNKINTIRSIFLSALSAVLVFIGSSNTLYAETGTDPGGAIHIVSDKLVVDTQKMIADFSGNVQARQNNTTIVSDKLTVHYSQGIVNKEDKQTDDQSVEKITAAGNVRINFDNRVAVADKAVYTASDRVLVLTGHDAKVSDAQNSITGEKITVFRADGRVIAESGKQKQVVVTVKTGKKGID